MAQYARPDSDTLGGNFGPDTGSTLWEAIDDTPSTSGDYIITDSALSTSAQVCEVGLTNITDPVSSSGHIIRFGTGSLSAGTNNVTIEVRLMQGGSLIGKYTYTGASASFGANIKTYTLSAGEADSITDYSDLRLYFYAVRNSGSNSMYFTCYGAELEVPDVSVVNITISGDATKNITFTGQAPTISISPEISIDAVKNITFTALGSTVIAVSEITIAADATKNITFTPLDPASIITTTDTTIAAGTAQNIAFTGLAATIDPHLTNLIVSNVPVVDFTGITPGLLITGFVSESAFDGSYKSWHTTPLGGGDYPGSSGRYYNVNEFVAYNHSSATGLRYNYLTITTPSDATDISVQVNWSYRKYGGESNNQFYVQWNGVNAMSATGDGTTDTVTGSFTKTGLTANTTYSLYSYLNTLTNVYPFAENIKITSITLTYLADITIAAPIQVSNVPSITFTKQDPTLFTNYSILQTVSNVPVVSLNGQDASVLTPGQVFVGTTTPVITVLGFAPALVITAEIIVDAVNAPTVSFTALNLDPFIYSFEDDLSFKYIASSDSHYTAADAEVLTGLDLGALLYNQEKTFSFRIGNTSNIKVNFVVSASSLNNLSNMVSFSTDKTTYSSSVNIDSVYPNTISDVIWGKIIVDDTAFISPGTFRINVEHTNAE